MPQFTDDPGGTPVDTTHLGALVVAAGYAQSSYAPTVSSSSLSFTQPGFRAVVPGGAGTALSVSVTAQIITFAPTMDTYVDVLPSSALILSAVTVNSATPPLPNGGNATRLYRVTTNATGVTALFQIAPITTPLTIDQIAADPSDYAVTDTAGWQHTLRYSLAALRSSLTAVVSSLTTYIPLTQKGATNGVPVLDATTHVIQDPAAFNSGTVRLANTTANVVIWGNGGTVPPSASGSAGEKLRLYDMAGSDINYGLGVEAGAQWYSVPAASGHSFYVGATRVARITNTGIVGGGGAAGGVASLDATSHVVQVSASGVRHIAVAELQSDFGLLNSYQGDPTTPANYGVIQSQLTNIVNDVGIPPLSYTTGIVSSGGSIVAEVSLCGILSLSNGNWIRLGFYLHAFQHNLFYFKTLGYKNVAANDYVTFAGARAFTGLPADTYSLMLLYQTGGPGTNQAYFFIRPASHGSEEFLSLTLKEIA